MRRPGMNQPSKIQSDIEGETAEVKCHAARVSRLNLPERIGLKAYPGVEPVLSRESGPRSDGCEFERPVLMALTGFATLASTRVPLALPLALPLPRIAALALPGAAAGIQDDDLTKDLLTSSRKNLVSRRTQREVMT